MNEKNISTRMLINRTKENINQLLVIGMVNSDKDIMATFGGERHLLELIKGYFCLLEDLTALWERENKND